MVRKVGVHDDHEVAGAVFEAVYVGRAEAEFACARLQVDVFGGVEFLELAGDDLGAIRGSVVDDYEFPVEVAAGAG